MSVISYLDKRAREAVLSSAEEQSIDTSIATIRARLNSYFGSDVNAHFRFGSSTRGTILPRSMDEGSDIDYMVVFSDRGHTPQTYLDRLKRFAEKYYSQSDIKQSSPSVILELGHIKFDLVPALKAQYSSDYEIPNGPQAWQNTNPNDFNASLTAKNNAELYKIKPMIRLLKFWNTNSYNGDVFDPYSLEKYVVATSYYGVTNIRDYLFTTFDGLRLSYGTAQWRNDRLDRAREIVKEVRDLEQDGYPYLAETEVKKLIPE